jgi:flagellar biosynthesis protein FlhG
VSKRPEGGRRRPEGLRVVPGSAPEPLAADHPATWGRSKTRTIAIASGKGGVGKSHLAANLAVALGQRGARVLLVDADFSQANLDLLLGVHPRHDIQHVLAGEKSLEEIVVAGPAGVTLVPAASGVPDLADLDDIRFQFLWRGIGQLAQDHDLVIIDTASGVSRLVTSFCLAADDVVVVTTPDMPAFSDAYGLIKVLHSRGLTRPPHLLVNMSASPEEAEETAHRIRLVARRFLRLDMSSWGPVPLDAAIAQAMRRQEPALLAYPSCPASSAYRDIAAQLWNPEVPDPAVPSSTPQRLEA